MSIDKKVLEAHGLTSADYKKIQKILDRDPNLTELGMYSVLWSEHCSYKHSKPLLKQFPTKGPRVLQGPGENAGVVDIGEGLAVCFKIESHNHPSQIEPYQGAATGVGGILRDIFTMGARPIACLNSLRFGPIDGENGASNRNLLSQVVSGIAGYGNCMGVPTVGGEVYFADEYTHSCLVNAMCIGILQSSNTPVHELYGPLVRGYAGEAGNKVFYVGSATGRDGIHGATFASKELSEESSSQRSSVQVGDPFMEKLLLEACLELIKANAVVGMQDMGAAGLTSSSSEMASRSGKGMELYMEKVPRREEGMTSYEILLSESQERMLVIMKPGEEKLAHDIFEKWGLHAVEIGRVTNDGMLRCYENGVVVAEVPARSLADDAPVAIVPSAVPYYIEQLQKFNFESLADIRREDAQAVFLKLLAQPNIASKQWIYRQYDHMVQTGTMLVPGAADAAVLRVKGYSGKLAATTDCNARYCYLNPNLGAQIAVAEAARNLACVGAHALAVTDNLNFANPEKPEMFWQLKEACAGISSACNAFEIPVISGNVSLYNETEEVAIYPTPVIGMVGLIKADVNPVGQAVVAGHPVVLIGKNLAGLGGSEFLHMQHDLVAGACPNLDLDLELKVQKLCLLAIEKGWVSAAHDCAEGGLAVTLAEMSIASKNIGMTVELQGQNLRLDELLFGEAQSRIVLGVKPECVDALVHAAAQMGVPCQKLGVAGADQFSIKVDGQKVIDVPLSQIIDRYVQAIPKLMQRH
jgi:phosphoribosylformylglycinamidine synthase II